MGQVDDFVWIFLKGCGFLSSNVRVWMFFRTNVWRQCGLENVPLSRLSDPESDTHFRFLQLDLVFIYKSRALYWTSVNVKYWMYITRPRSTLLHLIISQQRMRLNTTYTINLYPDINHSLNTRHFSVKHKRIARCPPWYPLSWLAPLIQFTCGATNSAEAALLVLFPQILVIVLF